MKMIFGAIALAVAVPAAAQTAPEEHKMECCDKDKAAGKECCCCKDMDKEGHDMKHEHQSKSDGGKTEQDHAGHAGHAH